MKAVIVEIRDKIAAALGEDGRVIKIKNKNYSIGQEIELSNRSKYIKIVASAAAVLILFVTPAWAYFTPYSYVSLDINPSFEFSINRFDLVLDVKALNNDGEKVVESMEMGTLKNKEIKEAVKSVLSELKDQGYIIDGKEGGVVVAASSKSSEKTNELAASLKTAVEEEVSAKTEEKEIILEEKQNNIERAEKGDLSEDPDEKKETEVNKQQKSEEPASESAVLKEGKEKEAEKESLYSEDQDKLKDLRNEKEKEKDDKKQIKNSKNYKKFEVEVIEVSLDEVDNAKIMGITPGKWSLIEKLQESSKSDFDEKEIEKWLEKSVSDIMKEIDKNNKEYNKEERKEYKEKKSSVKKTDKELDDEKRDGKNSHKRK